MHNIQINTIKVKREKAGETKQIKQQQKNKKSFHLCLLMPLIFHYIITIVLIWLQCVQMPCYMILEEVKQKIDEIRNKTRKEFNIRGTKHFNRLRYSWFQKAPFFVQIRKILCFLPCQAKQYTYRNNKHCQVYCVKKHYNDKCVMCFSVYALEKTIVKRNR